MICLLQFIGWMQLYIVDKGVRKYSARDFLTPFFARRKM